MLLAQLSWINEWYLDIICDDGVPVGLIRHQTCRRHSAAWRAATRGVCPAGSVYVMKLSLTVCCRRPRNSSIFPLWQPARLPESCGNLLRITMLTDGINIPETPAVTLLHRSFCHCYCSCWQILRVCKPNNSSLLVIILPYSMSDINTLLAVGLTWNYELACIVCRICI